LIPEETLIFSDEMWVEFNTTRRTGNPYLQADLKDKENGTIRVMV
jgi:hypothetical protein